MTATAEVGDLICWTANFKGFMFGEVTGINRNGMPLVRPYGTDDYGKPMRVQQSGYYYLVIKKASDHYWLNPELDKAINAWADGKF